MEDVKIVEESTSQVETVVPETQTEVVTETVSETAPVVEVKEDVPAVVETAPVVEAPVVEAPVVEAPVVEAPVVEAPVVHPGHGIIDEIEAKLAALGARVGSEVRGDFAEILIKLRKVL